MISGRKRDSLFVVPFVLFFVFVFSIKYSTIFSFLYCSDAMIWNLADIPITDTGLEISADTDSRSDIQLCSNFLPFSSNFLPFST